MKRTGAFPARRTLLKVRPVVTGLCTFCIFMLAALAAYDLSIIGLFIKALV